MMLKWKKFHSNAQLPTKRKTDVGYDVYSVENNIWMKPHETKMIPTGLGCIIEPGYWLQAADRGSTGSKGLHTHCGIIDEQYVGEIFIALHNTNPYPVYITGEVENVCFKEDMTGEKYMCYPVSKGIAQLIVHRNWESESAWATEDEWDAAVGGSERGDGKLGASGK